MARTLKPSPAPPKRVRRTAEDARMAILDAAEKRMAVVGPSGVRLQDVASDVGVSHPTVLHHFGSREALIAAVVDRSVSVLHTELVREIGKGRSGPEPIEEMLHAVARVLGPSGHARIAAWLALSGHPTDARSSDDVEAVAQAAHALRTSLRGKNTPPYEDTYFVVLLAALAMFGDAIVGPALHGRGRAKDDAAESARFRTWLAGLLQAHLQSGGTPVTKK